MWKNFLLFLSCAFFFSLSTPPLTFSLNTTSKTLTTTPHIWYYPFHDFFFFKDPACFQNPFPLNLEINFSSKLFPCSKRPLCFRLPNHFCLRFSCLCIYVFVSYSLFFTSLLHLITDGVLFVYSNSSSNVLVNPTRMCSVRENTKSLAPWSTNERLHSTISTLSQEVFCCLVQYKTIRFFRKDITYKVEGLWFNFFVPFLFLLCVKNLEWQDDCYNWFGKNLNGSGRCLFKV